MTTPTITTNLNVVGLRPFDGRSSWDFPSLDPFDRHVRAIRRQRNLGTCPRCGCTVDPSAPGVWESADGSCDGCRAKEAS